MYVIHKQRCLGAGFALKLSKFFNFQGIINKNMEQLSLNPRELQSFLGKTKHQCLKCSRDCRLRMIMGYKIRLTITARLAALTTH